MISREEIDNLANLARLELDEAQKGSLAKDLDSILGYFEQLKEAKVDEAELGAPTLANVMRADVAAELPPAAAKTLVETAPKHNGQYIRVKKIL